MKIRTTIVVFLAESHELPNPHQHFVHFLFSSLFSKIVPQVPPSVFNQAKQVQNTGYRYILFIAVDVVSAI